MADLFGRWGEKTAYQTWQENKKKQKASKSPVRTNQGGDYAQKNYTGSSETRKTSYDWEKALLKPLPSKSYGRSYADKYDSWAASKGLSPSEAKEFRTWMDSKDDKVQTKSSLFNDILSGGNTRAEDSLKRNPIKPATKLDAIKKKPSQERGGFLGFLDSTLGRASDAAQGLVLGKDFTKAQNENYKKIVQDKMKSSNPNDRKLGAEIDKMVNRTSRKPKNALEKGADLFGSGVGVASYLVPGSASEMIAAKGLNALKGIKPAGQLASKLATTAGEKGLSAIAKKTAKSGIKGASSGLVFGAGETSLRELIDGQNYTASDNAKRIGQEALFGALGNPVLEGIGNLASRGLGRLSKNNLPSSMGPRPQDELLGLPEPQRLLNAPQTALPAPRETPAFNNVFRQPEGPNSPIPSMPDAMKAPLNFGRLNKANVGFGYNAKNEPKARFDLSGKEPVVDPMKRGQQYWQNRYEDFANTVSKSYDMNRMTPEGLDQAWSQFAKYDEPVSLNQVVDLAYPKGFEAPPVPKAPQPEPPLKQALREDPRINEAVQGFFPPEIPKQPISRPATFEEMVQRMQELSPPKQEAPKLEPLQFKKTIQQPNSVPNLKDVLNPTKSESIRPMPLDNGGKMTKIEPTVNGTKVELESRLTTLRDNLKQATTKKAKEGIRKEILQVRKGLDDIKQRNLTESDYTFNDLLANSDNWKDKASPLLKRETMQRNFEDMMGPEDAGKLKKIILEPIGREEANSVRFKNTERNAVKKFKINGNTKDSSLVQKYGEGKVTLDELKGQTKNWENVVKTAEHLRQRYDELLPDMNKVLKEHGYPEVPFRKNYFPHMEDVTKFQNFLKKHVGIDFEDHTLPTDINGLTENFKPGKRFFRNALQRKGDKTAYDAIVGFDKYLEGVSNVIYHTKNIKRLRSFESAVRKKYPSDGSDNKHLANFVTELDEFTNMLAGKKVGFDHKTEKYTSRKVYTFVDNMRKRTASNMLAFNVSSGITSLIPSLTQAPALTGKKYFVKGMLDTMANVVKKDGFESDFLTRRIGSDPLHRDLWGKVTEKGFWLMKTLDNFSSQTIVRSKYYELLDKGLPEKEAKNQADEFASKILADRSKGSMPTLFADKTLGLLTQFQLEVNNQMSFLFKDIPKMSKNKAAMASAYGQVFLYSYLFNTVFEQMTGRRPAFDPVGVALNANEDYNNDNISKGEATWKTIENVSNQLPFSSMFTGGRFPIEAGVPQLQDAMQGKSTLPKELAKPLTYLVPPTGGGQAKKAYQTLTDFGLNPTSPQDSAGVYKGDKLVYPIDGSKTKATQELLFGRSSLPETRSYYDNKRTPLSEGQTKAYKRLEKDGLGNKLYDALRVKKLKPSDKAKFTRIENSEKLSDDEKLQKLRDLLNQLGEK